MTDSFVTANQLRKQLDMVRQHNKELLREAQQIHDLALNRYNGLCEDMSKIQELVKEQKALITSQDNQIAGLRWELSLLKTSDQISDLRFKMGVLRQDVDNTIREDKWLRGDLWNRFNYLAERQDKVDVDINTTHQHIVSLGQHQHACDANFLYVQVDG